MLSQSSSERTGYDHRGGFRDPDSPECVAKMIHYPGTGQTHYYIRWVRTGLEAGTVLRCADPAFNAASELRKQAKQMGSEKYSFCKVKREAFEHYLKYLQTGNAVYARHAERVI
jgi:hypothetical protein